jgi:hypothetical protein
MPEVVEHVIVALISAGVATAAPLFLWLRARAEVDKVRARTMADLKKQRLAEQSRVRESSQQLHLAAIESAPGMLDRHLERIAGLESHLHTLQEERIGLVSKIKELEGQLGLKSHIIQRAVRKGVISKASSHGVAAISNNDLVEIEASLDPSDEYKHEMVKRMRSRIEEQLAELPQEDEVSHSAVTQKPVVAVQATRIVQDTVREADYRGAIEAAKQRKD